MRKSLWILLGATALFAAACGKAPDAVAAELFKAGDRAKAQQVLEKAEQDKPQLKPVRYMLFVLYRDLSMQGDPAKQPEYLKQAIGEYDWIAKAEGVAPDYTKMEESLQASPQAKAAYEAAYHSVYNR